jgi:cell wall-associated NlpC family hydrolase
MTPYFQRSDRVAALRAAAQAWVGTPFSPNGCARGRGVSCQKLAAALLREAGLPLGEVPDAPMSQARFSRRSLVEEWFRARPFFAPQPPRPGFPFWAGDILGFRVGRVIHHLGVALDAARFIHCLEHLGVSICPVQDPTWAGRLAAIWRPVEWPVPAGDLAYNAPVAKAPRAAGGSSAGLPPAGAPAYNATATTP